MLCSLLPFKGYIHAITITTLRHPLESSNRHDLLHDFFLTQMEHFEGVRLLEIILFGFMGSLVLMVISEIGIVDFMLSLGCRNGPNFKH